MPNITYNDGYITEVWEEDEQVEEVVEESDDEGTWPEPPKPSITSSTYDPTGSPPPAYYGTWKVNRIKTKEEIEEEERYENEEI